jgi:signal transduction histidine kinase
MRIPGLRTISGRIVVGFAVLILTFGGVTLWTIVNISVLTREVKAISSQISHVVIAKDLRAKQEALERYLKELPRETSRERVVSRLKHLREDRLNVLREAGQSFEEELAELPAKRKRAVERTLDTIARFERDIAKKDRLYDELVAAPPLEREATSAPAAGPDAARAAAERALATLQREEKRFWQGIWRFERAERGSVETIGERLEAKAVLMRRLTIYLGAIAVFCGLVVTVWATMTLRSLTRLRAAARRIAAGEYGSRIEERGPDEVAGLAREFNAMGQAVEERERELVRSERLAAVGKMAAVITHEVRNPLSSIGLNTELLDEELGAIPGQAGGEARALCKAITAEVDRLTAITEEYLHFARLPKPKLQSESINSIVDSLVAFEREQLAVRGVQLAVELGAELPPVLVDDAQIRQALLNLLRNAADAVAEVGSGTVAVRTARRGARAGGGAAAAEMVEVTVEDDGPGIARELVAKIFDPFFSTKEGGTGLGLALTHEIVREHGGSIDVHSEPGHGTRFIVALPCAPSASDPGDAARASPR